MVKKYVVHMSVGYTGMDGVDALLVEDDWTEEQIQQEPYYMAVDHAESYGYYPSENGFSEDEDEHEDSNDHYVDSIDGWAEPYDPKEHDCLRSGGGSFEDDFARMMVP